LQRFEVSVIDAIYQFRDQKPEEPALSFEDSTLSWRGLAEAVERAAVLFHGKVPGETLALLLPNAPSLVVCFLAGVQAGKNVQLLDSAWPRHTIVDVLNALQSGALVTTTDISAHTESILLKDPYAPVPDILTTLIDNLDGVDSTDGTLPPPDTARPFYTGFTSGSTGMPKGFQRNQRSWLESFRGDQALFRFGELDVVAAPGNLAHSLFLYAVIRGLYGGCHTIFFRSFRPDRILKQARDSHATILYGVPTQYDAMCTAAEGESETLPELRLILSSGAKLPEPLKPRLRSLFPNAKICEFYGTSEQSYVSVARDGDAPPGSVGQPFPGIRLRVLDDNGAECPPGQVGHVFVDSALTFIGYAVAEQPTFQRDGTALCVGDLGYLDEAGYLFLVGRADRMILISGKNVYPEEIEATLMTHPAISFAAVFGVDDKRRGQRLVAVVKRNKEEALSRSDLISWSREKLPLHKVPMDITERADWPLTVSHKTDLPRLRAMLAENKLDALT
jgi:long-chain acyl-CoA synthetase